VCRDLSEIATYARVDNSVYRLLKHHTPGPYTFILRATTEVPRRLMQSKRRTIGLRVPENAVTQALLGDLGEPLMSVTLIMPGDDLPLIDPYEIRELLEHHVDLVIDGGYCGMEATTVVDLADDEPMLLRAGKGDTTPFEAP
jgi:tRNA threonylcarbamoyl adenosine modification protein (Sua5/YciO/YrdC/YwlC family)